VGERRSEDAHHGVADELLHDAPERLDLAADAIVVRGQNRANLLGVELLGPGGEPDEVDEDDGDDPPFVPGQVLLAERKAAGETEASDRDVFLAAGWADDRRRQGAARFQAAENCGLEASVWWTTQ
jgi:hypothetical protein